MPLFVLGSFVQACCWNIARLPKSGETFTASAFNMEAGGKGLNVAIGTRRLGIPVEIALGVGRDDAAQQVTALLKQEGVGITHVHALADRSGYGAGLIAADGQNMIAVYPGPNLLLEAAHMQNASADIQRSDMVYAQFETALPAIAQAFSIARQHQKTTVLNPSPWQEIPPEILQHTDWLIVNEIEAGELFAFPHIEFSHGIEVMIEELAIAAKRFFANGSGSGVVVTLGQYGCVALLPNGTHLYAPAQPIQAIDTIGAGDAFASGFCAGLLKKQPLADALTWGNTCGAHVAGRQGVLTALPHMADIRSQLEKHT